jgi:LPS-assembly protein
MKNSIIFIIFSFFINSLVFAENIKIKSKKISIDKNSQISIFEEDVIIKTSDNITIKSDYAKYNKLNGTIELKNNIETIDEENNIIKTSYANYDEKKKILETKGLTQIITPKKYILNGENIIANSDKKLIFSNDKTIITDEDNNSIFLENFEYLSKENIFKSIGHIEIKDKLENSYQFSQIYIDTKKKEILGTDTKSFLNSNSFKINNDNDPRVFANTAIINNEQIIFNKSISTICKYRENDKCPPWTIQAKKMLHDKKKKTIYYDNAIIKVYDFPIFYIPKLSHPDPTVVRRSGFLPPTLLDTKNLGSGISVPYFWALNKDKNFTLTSKVFFAENPLLVGEYNQVFKNSNFLTDFGYTEGYKKSTTKKKAGNKSHFFSKFTKNFSNSDSNSTLNISTQNVSNDKYLKLYKIESNLVDYNIGNLENSINFTHENENTFFGLDASVYETLNENYNDKYEYILPEVTIDKNLISNDRIGNIDFTANYKAHKYDTNKFTNFLINDFNWNSKDIYFDNGLKGEFLGHFKNINYETKNLDDYKKDTTSELFGAIGYLSELNFEKKIGTTSHLLKPKTLLRYAPGAMRKEFDGPRLDPLKAFSLDRINNINNFETGLSGTIGLDYKAKRDNNNFDFSVAQVLSEKENKKMASKTSMDEKLSDLVGSTSYGVNNKFNINYNFAVDQNYKQLNYNDFGANFDFNPVKIKFNYLLENEHIGNQEYFNTKVDFVKNKNGLFSFETKRNLITDSSEFYNLSYEYINDCLRAGLVYRREFYNDSELEAENSLLFKITLTPFGNINSPSFNK